MSISGNLRTMELAELLQWLHQGVKTGTLVINNGRIEKRIVFQQGGIVATASNDPKEYLGHFLLSHGFIDETTLAQAIEMQETNRMMLGKILVTVGAISEPDLDRMLRLKAEETIYDLFTWTEGRFRFLDDDVLSLPMVPLKLNVTGVVLEGVQRIDEWGRIREQLPSCQSVPVKVAELEPPEEDALARRIFSLVDDDRTIEEIALHSHTSDFQVCRALYEPVVEGRVKIVRPRVIGGADRAEGTAAADGVGADSLLETAAEHLQDGDYDLTLRYLRAAQSLDPESQRAKEAMQRTEETIRRNLAKVGIDEKAVPRLQCSFQDLTQLDITPQEGFILTRVNDNYDIQTILKISPMPPIDAMLVFWRLVQAGHISLGAPGR